MKHILKIILLFSIYCNGQAIKDTLTTVEKDTIVGVKSSWYGRALLTSLTTGSDTKGETLSQRMVRNLEFGRSFGSVDVGVGLDVGVGAAAAGAGMEGAGWGADAGSTAGVGAAWARARPAAHSTATAPAPRMPKVKACGA